MVIPVDQRDLTTAVERTSLDEQAPPIPQTPPSNPATLRR